MQGSIRSGGYRRWLGLGFLAFAWIVADRASAQSDRTLELPEGRQSKILEWMSQLASKNDFANETTNTSRPFDPQQIEQLQKLLRQFGDPKPKNGESKKSDPFSTELLSKALADPKIREQATELLKRYRASQSKTPSQSPFDLNEPARPKPASSETSRPASPDPRNRTSENGDRTKLPPASKAPPASRPGPATNFIEPNNTRTPQVSNAPADSTSEIKEPRSAMPPDTLARFPNPTESNPQGPKPEQSPFQPPQEYSPPDSTASATIPEMSSQPPSATSLPDAKSLKSNQQNSNPGRVDNSTDASNIDFPHPKTPSTDNDRNRSDEWMSSLEDFAKSLDLQSLSKELVPGKNKTLDNQPGKNNDQPGRSNLRNNSGESFPAPGNNANQADDSRAAFSNEMKQKLQDKGFNAAFQDIVNQARQASREPKKSSSPDKANSDSRTNSSTNSDWAESLIKTLDGMRSSPNKKASSASNASAAEAKQPTPKSTASKSNQTAAENRTNKTNNSYQKPNSSSQSKSISDRFSDFSKYFQSSPSRMSQRSSVTPSLPRKPFRPIDLSLGNVLSYLKWPAILLLALGVAWLAWRLRHRPQNTTPQDVIASDLITAPTLIRTRSDVIRAFHQLAFRVAKPLQLWWTPNRVAFQVHTPTTSVQSAMQVAVDVYEQSRYLPPDAQLSEEQLSSIRGAIVVLESAQR